MIQKGGWPSLPHVEEFKWLRGLFTSEEKNGVEGRQADWCSVCTERHLTSLAQGMSLW